MFKPIRFLFLVVFAFLAGVMFERFNTSETCKSNGGTMDAGLCRGAS